MTRGKLGGILRMILTVHGDIPAGETFMFSVGGATKEIDDSIRDISFVLNIPGEYILEFEQKPKKRYHKVISTLFFIITMLIQGVFHIFFMDISSEWYKRVQPYRIKGRMKVNMTENQMISLSCSEARYNDFGRWIKPKCVVSESNEVDIIYLNNGNDFIDKYLIYIKRLISVAGVGITLFVCLLVNSLKANIISASIVLSICLIFTVIVSMVLIISQYKKMIKLYNDFCDHFITDKD